MAFAILRTQKIKSQNHLKNTSGHNNRTKKVLNADPKKERFNIVLKGSKNAFKAVSDRYIKTAATQRKNGVLAVEVMLTASPEFFKADKENLRKYCSEATKFLNKEFGSDNVVSVILHRDEITPHIHAIVTPLELKSEGRFQGQWRQNAKNWLGGREKMSQLQDRFAEQMSVLDLDRGVKGSQAKHTTVKQYYHFMNDIASIKKADFAIEKPPLINRNQYVFNLQKQLKPVFQTAKKTTKIQRENKELKKTVEKLENDKKLLYDQMRDIPLSKILPELGYEQDKYNKKKYRIHERSAIVVNENKWYDHHFSQETGGVGAINLVMHCCDFDNKQAVAWLADRFSSFQAQAAIVAKSRDEAKEQVQQIQQEKKPFEAPKISQDDWPAVRDYLINIRKFDSNLIDQAHAKNRIYATRHKGFVNCVFWDGKETAEAEGIGNIRFKQLVPGSKKRESGFQVGKGKKLVLVESAVDALSYYELSKEKKDISVVSLAGSNSHATYIKKAHKEGREIVFAGDNDKAGNVYFNKINRLIDGNLKREKPRLKDWNEDLKDSKKETGSSKIHQNSSLNLPFFKQHGKSKIDIEKEKRVRNVEKMADAMAGRGPGF